MMRREFFAVATLCALVTGSADVIARDGFPDNIRPPETVTVIGDSARMILAAVDSLLMPVYAVERRKTTEERLATLVTGVEVIEESAFFRSGWTWTVPLCFDPSPGRRFFLAVYHMGTGHFMDLCAIHEQSDGSVAIHTFIASGKGTTNWRPVVDLDGDGTPEILVKHFFGEYLGAGTTVAWTGVFRWTGERYERADERFPVFYRDVMLPELEALVPVIEASADDDWGRSNRRYIRMTIDRARELAGSDR